jgi:hypothetical protein
MYAELGNQNTALLIECLSCGATAHDSQRFCRNCGRRVIVAAFVTTHLPQDISLVNGKPSSQFDRKSDKRLFLSGDLATSMVNGLAEKYANQLKSKSAKKTFRFFVSMAVCLLLVLLSPFDAYCISRSYVEEESCL